MTASGSFQLSYWAAKTRNTNTTARMKAYRAVSPAWFWRYVSSVHSNAIARGVAFPAIRSISGTTSPLLVPGATFPVMAAAG